ncbi:MAG: ATP-binding protein [Planctomycetes bacterium]|nr:ATP-binding protein [Planctomycetota bacterium]
MAFDLLGRAPESSERIMGAFPRSDLPGHANLDLRIRQALDVCRESAGVEFKEACSWDGLRHAITKTALGMANQRDGGIIIIGVSERGCVLEPSGISGDLMATFDPDTIADYLNSFASPRIEIDSVLRIEKERQFLVIGIREFAETPVVCKKNGPDGHDMTKGCFYVRLSDPPKTSKVVHAEEMHALLELAAEKRATRMLQVVHRLGVSGVLSDADRFTRELDGL